LLWLLLLRPQLVFLLLDLLIDLKYFPIVLVLACEVFLVHVFWSLSVLVDYQDFLLLHQLRFSFSRNLLVGDLVLVLFVLMLTPLIEVWHFLRLLDFHTLFLIGGIFLLPLTVYLFSRFQPLFLLLV